MYLPVSINSHFLCNFIIFSFFSISSMVSPSFSLPIVGDGVEELELEDVVSTVIHSEGSVSSSDFFSEGVALFLLSQVFFG